MNRLNILVFPNITNYLSSHPVFFDLHLSSELEIVDPVHRKSVHTQPVNLSLELSYVYAKF